MSVYAWNPFPKKVPANFQSALNGCTCLENFSTLQKKEKKQMNFTIKIPDLMATSKDNAFSMIDDLESRGYIVHEAAKRLRDDATRHFRKHTDTQIRFAYEMSLAGYKIHNKPHITLEEYTAKTSESQIDATIAMGIKANQLIANSDIFLEKMKKGVLPF